MKCGRIELRSRRFSAVVAALLLLSTRGLAFEETYLNFESGPVRPLALSPTGDILFAANTPDNRVEVFLATAAGLERVGEVVVGLEPVALAAPTASELYVVNHLSDSVSVVDVSDPAVPFVKATLLVGDEPRDVVVAGPLRNRVFVTTAHRGQNNPRNPEPTTPGVGRADVWVFDTDALDAAPHVLTLFCDTPRALAVSPDGTRVYAAAFHSGNRTTALSARAVEGGFASPILGGFGQFGDGFESPRMAPPIHSETGVRAPKTGLILQFDGEAWRDPLGRDWTPRVRFDLPDLDVFTIDATREPPVELEAVAHVGTVLFNMAVNPCSY